MAARRQQYRGRAAHRRVNSTGSGSSVQRSYYYVDTDRRKMTRLDTYEDGNAVRRLDLDDEEDEEKIPERPRKVSKRTRENRERAMTFGIGYIIFLTVVCLVSVYFCIHYLQLRSEYISQNEQIASMQDDLSKLTADNDALYKSALASVSMDDVRDTALNELNLKYATESQIYYYDASDDSYVRQYTDVDGK
ncbi:MAG: hypothetical protein ACOYA9_04030 [Bilifractor sp.]